jgi:MHS family shikimate/dehydroshikimate transporter-like MFS transporter
VLMAVEHAPEGKKGFFGSLPQAGVASGLILSSLAMTAISGLSEKEMLAWGWRIPFLASFVLLAVGWFIRMNVAESSDFKKLERLGEKVKVPVSVVCRDHMREVLVVVGARLAEVTWFYTVASFALVYTTTSQHVPKTVMLNATIWGATVVFFTIPLFGMIGDRVGQKWVFILGAVGILACGPVFFQLLATRDPFWIDISMILALGVVYGLLYGPEGHLFSSQFPAEVRYTGISLAVQVSGALGGGLAPIVATYLLGYADGDPKYAVAYVGFLGVVGTISAWLMGDESRLGEAAQLSPNAVETKL